MANGIVRTSKQSIRLISFMLI